MTTGTVIRRITPYSQERFCYYRLREQKMKWRKVARFIVEVTVAGY